MGVWGSDCRLDTDGRLSRARSAHRMACWVFLRGAVPWPVPVSSHPSSQHRLRRSCAFLALVASVACRSDGSTGPVESPSHAVGASLLLYDNNSNDGIREAELLLDGKKVTANQNVTNGTFQYLLTLTWAYLHRALTKLQFVLSTRSTRRSSISCLAQRSA
jgi:hypothetical protein